MKPKLILEKFDVYLKDRGLNFSAIVIGGAALSILGVITRQTQDVDILDPEIPEDILTASREFAVAFKIEQSTLKENWLNHGPESLRNYLMDGWKKRIIPLYVGEAIHFQTLGRIDLIGTKVLAYCDRGFDLQDCIDLKITKSELEQVIDWVKNYDLNPNWPSYVESQVKILAEKSGYEL